MTYRIRLELDCEADDPEMAEAMFRETFSELRLFSADLLDQNGNIVRVFEPTEELG